MVAKIKNFFLGLKNKLFPVKETVVLKEPPKAEQPPAPPAQELIPTYESVQNYLLGWYKGKVGVVEKGGNNKGKEVEEFQKAVDGKAQGEAWCMAFMQAGLKAACEHYESAFKLKKDLYKRVPIKKTEGCTDAWENCPPQYKLSTPKVGAWFIMRKFNSWQGHTGVVTTPVQNKVFGTVEGNTDDGGSREGDGVYSKARSINGTKTMYMSGYIDVVGAILDTIKKEL